VELDGFHNQSARVFQGWAGCYTAGQVRDVGAPVARHLLKRYRVFHHFFQPARLIIEFNVPGVPRVLGCPFGLGQAIMLAASPSVTCQIPIRQLAAASEGGPNRLGELR
jgi:hypothetical protein